MPLFNGHGPDCWKSVVKFMIIFILIDSAIAIIALNFIGLYAGVGLIALTGVILYYIIDQFADKWFTDPQYKMTKKEMEEFGKKKIILPHK